MLLWGIGLRQTLKMSVTACVCVFVSLRVFTKTDLFCRYLLMSLNSKISLLHCYSESLCVSCQLELPARFEYFTFLDFVQMEISEKGSDQNETSERSD